MNDTNLRLGALGGPSTFGGQAASLLQQQRPEFTEIIYLPSVEEVYGDLGWSTDANCVPDQMSSTGHHEPTQSRLLRQENPLYVAGEVSHEYGCRLLAKEGARIEDIRRVLGHTGSIGQSRGWLAEHLPSASIEVVHSHSLGAGMSVLDSDGSSACVGTVDLERQLGLVTLASDIDEGSVCNYYAISSRPMFVPRPRKLVVTLAGDDDGELHHMTLALAAIGFDLATVYSAPRTDRIFRYRHVTRWQGTGALESVQHATDQVPGADLRGAYA